MIRPEKILAQIENREKEFKKSQFLAPIHNKKIYVTVLGMSTILEISSSKFEWAIIQPTSFHRAKVIRQAKPEEVNRYILQLPRVSLILAKKHKEEWLGFPAYQSHSILGDLSPFSLRPIKNARGSRFSQVATGFDGTAFWFLFQDSKRHSFLQASLQYHLEKRTQSENLNIKGLTKQERLIYKLILEMEKEPIEKMLVRVVQHGGGKLKSYSDQGDSYVVHFSVENEAVTAAVKKDLQVMSAGFCLDGHDEDFDLTSLVSVVREGRGKLYYE